MAPASADVVAARDKAILDALKIRTWPEEGLFTVMPHEPGLTDAQRQAALSSALIRLRVKRLIKAVPGGWAAA